MKENNYVGNENWAFSDEVYFNLTGERVISDFNPKIEVKVKELTGLLKKKKLLLLCWSTPTFKDIDCSYLFHVNDKKNAQILISPSSGNTVEGVARAITKYNNYSHKKIKAILIVPDISAYKVDNNFIENNPNVIFIIIKKSNLDNVRDIANRLKEYFKNKYNVMMADADLKTAAYAQIGLFLNKLSYMNDNCCIVQTVSGGVGLTGVIEAAYKLKKNPELLIVQPKDGKSTPTVDALREFKSGKDYMNLFKNNGYETPQIETTLGSMKPIYSIKKFINWSEKGGRISAVKVSKDEILKYKNKIMELLIENGIYRDLSIAKKLFEYEKSGYIAIIGAILFENELSSQNIIVNFTGRYLPENGTLPKSAPPHVEFNSLDDIEILIKLLKQKIQMDIR